VSLLFPSQYVKVDKNEEYSVLEWLVALGDTVEAGQSVAEIEFAKKLSLQSLPL